jgi:hypothetical protein
MNSAVDFCFYFIRGKLIELLLSSPTTLEELNVIVNELSEFQEKIEELANLSRAF